MKKLLLILTSIGSVSAVGLPIQACGENDQPSTTTNNEQSNSNENNETPLPALSDVLTATTLADIASAESKDIIDAIQSANTDLAAIADTNFTIEPIADDDGKVTVKVENYEGSVEVSFTVKQALSALSDVLTQEIISKITIADESSLADEIKTLSTSLADKEIHITNVTTEGATIEVDGYTGAVDVTFPTPVGLTGAMVDDLKNKGLWETISTSLGDITPDKAIVTNELKNSNLGLILDNSSDTIIAAVFNKNTNLEKAMNDAYTGEYSNPQLVVSEITENSAKVAVEYTWTTPSKNILTGWETSIAVNFNTFTTELTSESIDLTTTETPEGLKEVTVDNEGYAYISGFGPHDTTVGVEDLFGTWFNTKYNPAFTYSNIQWNDDVKVKEGEPAPTGDHKIEYVVVGSENPNTYSLKVDKITITEEATKKSKDVENIILIFNLDQQNA